MIGDRNIEGVSFDTDHGQGASDGVYQQRPRQLLQAEQPRWQPAVELEAAGIDRNLAERGGCDGEKA